MSLLESFILGALQGLTEFLPISSSGHIMVGQYIFGLKEEPLTFNIATHLGAALAVITVYWKVIAKIFKDLFSLSGDGSANLSLRLILLVLVASLPTAIIGLAFLEIFRSMFESLFVVAVAFFVTGTVLYITEKRVAGRGPMKGDFFDLSGVVHVSYRQALIVGVSQAFALIPGISRAGATIAAGLYCGLDRRNAALLSFMMSVPAILGASIMESSRVVAIDPQELMPLAFGTLISYIFAIIGLKIVLSSVREGRLHIFSYYLWFLSIGLLGYIFLMA